MPARILIVHPPAVSELAEAIATVFRTAGVVAEPRATDEVESLHEFDSLVVCGRVERGVWRDEAVAFLGRFRRHLSHLTVAYAVGIPPGWDPNRDPRTTERALEFVLDWYNEIRPVKLGLFHLERPDALDQVRAWTETLKPNFIGTDLEAPSGVRTFLTKHPLYERMNASELPIEGMSATEERISRGPPPGESP